MDFWRDHCTQSQEASLQTMSTSTGKQVERTAVKKR